GAVEGDAGQREVLGRGACGERRGPCGGAAGAVGLGLGGGGEGKGESGGEDQGEVWSVGHQKHPAVLRVLRVGGRSWNSVRVARGGSVGPTLGVGALGSH